MRLSITVALLTALMFPASVASAQSTDTLTLTTYNIHSAIPDGYSNADYWPTVSDLQNVADVLTSAGAQVIGLQEVRNLWDSPQNPTENQHPINFSLYLAGLLNMEYVFGSGLEVIPGRLNPDGDNRVVRENRSYLEWGTAAQWTNNGARIGHYGNAILSSLPLNSPPQSIKLPRGTDAIARRLGDEPRQALRVELKDPLGSLGQVIIYNTHFQHNNPKTRQMQIEYLISQANADLAPGNSSRATTVTVFLMGDFNHAPLPDNDTFLDTVMSAGFIDLAAEFARQTNTAPRPTIGDREKGRRIDYIFSSRPVEIMDVNVIDTRVSDHIPVTATIRY